MTSDGSIPMRSCEWDVISFSFHSSGVEPRNLLPWTWPGAPAAVSRRGSAVHPGSWLTAKQQPSQEALVSSQGQKRLSLCEAQSGRGIVERLAARTKVISFLVCE